MGIEPEREYVVHFALTKMLARTNELYGGAGGNSDGRRENILSCTACVRPTRGLMHRTKNYNRIYGELKDEQVQGRRAPVKGARANELSRGTRGIQLYDWLVIFWG